MNNCVASELTSASTEIAAALLAATTRELGRRPRRLLPAPHDWWRQSATAALRATAPRRARRRRQSDARTYPARAAARDRDRIDQDVASGSLLTLSKPERSRDRLRHQIGKRERRQVDQPDAVGEFTHQISRQPHGQPCFTHATGTRQRYQSGGGQHLRQFDELLSTSDEARQFSGQVMAAQLARTPGADNGEDASDQRGIGHELDRGDETIALARARSRRMRDSRESPNACRIFRMAVWIPASRSM